MKSITKSELTEFLKKQVVLECGVPYDEVDINKEFVDFRMDSVSAVFIMDRLEKYLEVELSPLYFWDNPTIDSFTTFLMEKVVTKNAHP
jgi:acyl carrier protein